MKRLTHDEVKHLDNFFNTFFSAEVPVTKHQDFIVAVKKLTKEICARQFSVESAVAEGGNSSIDEGENTWTDTCSSDSDQTYGSMFETTKSKSQKSKLPTHKDVPSQIDTLCIPESKHKDRPGKFTQHCQKHGMVSGAIQETLHKINEDENARAWITLKLFLRKVKKPLPKGVTKRAFYNFLCKSITSISKTGSVDQDTIPSLEPQSTHKKGRFFRFFKDTMTLDYLSNFLAQFTKNSRAYSIRLSARLSTIVYNIDHEGFPIVHAVNASMKRTDSNPFSATLNTPRAEDDSLGAGNTLRLPQDESGKESQAAGDNDRPEVPTRGIAAGNASSSGDATSQEGIHIRQQHAGDATSNDGVMQVQARNANSNNNAPEDPFVLSSAFLLPGDNGYKAPTNELHKYVPGEIRFDASKDEQTEQKTAKQNASYAVHDFPAFLKKHWHLLGNPSEEIKLVLTRNQNFLKALGLQVESEAPKAQTEAPSTTHTFFRVHQDSINMHRNSVDSLHFLSTFEPWIKKGFGKRIDRSRAAAIALVLTPSLLAVSSGAITPLLANSAWIMAPIYASIVLSFVSLLILTVSCKYLHRVYAPKDSIFNKAVKNKSNPSP